jgi:hypothetical protein
MKVILVLLVGIQSFSVFAQKRYAHYDSLLHNFVGGNELSHMWYVYDTCGMFNGAVLDFLDMPGRCGEEFLAAVGIVANPTDTIRVILPCYKGHWEIGDKVELKIEPPVNISINIPNGAMWGGYKHSSKKKRDWQVNRYDAVIKETVFGSVLK